MDAHALIWAADNPDKLGPSAVSHIKNPDNELLVSSGTIWEISIKASLGKMRFNCDLAEWLKAVIEQLDLKLLPLTVEHAVKQATLPFHHGDPFDRLVVAQCLHEGYPLISCDQILDEYGIQRIW